MKMNESGLRGFIPRFLQRFPSFAASFKKEFDGWDEAPGPYNLLDIVVMPTVSEALRREGRADEIKPLFDFFEETLQQSDGELHDLIGISVCEDLCSHEDLLQKAVRYMGPRTKEMCDEIVRNR